MCLDCKRNTLRTIYNIQYGRFQLVGISDRFKKKVTVITRHINNAFKECELEESNMHFLHNTQYKYRPTKIYDLDTIISVGVTFVISISRKNWSKISHVQNLHIWVPKVISNMNIQPITSIVRHINNIYQVDELDREATCAKIAHVQFWNT